MTEDCPDCGRQIWPGTRTARRGDCLGTETEDGLRECLRIANQRLRLELAAAKAASELSTAEREVVDAACRYRECAIAWHLDAFSNTARPFTEAGNELREATDALLALRAQKAEG